MPVSIIAMSALTLPNPFPDFVELKSPSTLLTPVGKVEQIHVLSCPVQHMQH